MPDLPVVEELLEKGARALVRYQSSGLCDENYPEQCSTCDCFHAQAKAAMGHGFRRELEQVSVVLDAVFPGWREYAPLLTAVATGEGITRTREPMLFGEQLRIRQITTIRGPWVPVEEGTDG